MKQNFKKEATPSLLGLLLLLHAMSALISNSQGGMCGSTSGIQKKGWGWLIVAPCLQGSNVPG